MYEIITEWEKQKWAVGRNENHYSSIFFDRLSTYNHLTKTGAAGWKSLKAFYGYRKEIQPLLSNNTEGILTKFWAELDNVKAVANRFKIVVNLLSGAFEEIKQQNIKVVSIASGSADSVAEAIKRHPDKFFDVTLIDLDRSALQRAEEETADIKNADFKFVYGSYREVSNVCQESKADVIEMVGLMDYFSHEKGASTVKLVKDSLSEGGFFFTGNIKWSPEKYFLYWVVLWPPMQYRTVDQLARILFDGGFKQEFTKIIQEPFKIHMISMCRNK